MLMPNMAHADYAECTYLGGNAQAGTPAHTAGSWVQFVSATPRDANGIYFNQDWSDLPLVDIYEHATELGIGPPGEERVLVPMIPTQHGGRLPRHHHSMVLFPVAIKKGSRIVARSQHLYASYNIWCAINPIYGSAPAVGTLVSSIGFDAAASRGTQVVGNATPNLWGAWYTIGEFAHPTVGIITSMTKAYGTMGGFQYLVVDAEVAIGPVGAETIIARYAWATTAVTSSRSAGLQEPNKPFRALRIPRGVRVAARIKTNYANFPVFVTIHGIH